jgi:hypothetical protein
MVERQGDLLKGWSPGISLGISLQFLHIYLQSGWLLGSDWEQNRGLCFSPLPAQLALLLAMKILWVAALGWDKKDDGLEQ